MSPCCIKPPKLIHGEQEQRKRKGHVSRFPVQFFIMVNINRKNGPMFKLKNQGFVLDSCAGVECKI
jgi:hypothetical protein